MEELISRIFKKIAGGPADEIWISTFDLDPGLRAWPAIFVRRCPKPVNFRRNLWEFHRLLPFLQLILRVSGHTYHFSGEN